MTGLEVAYYMTVRWFVAAVSRRTFAALMLVAAFFSPLPAVASWMPLPPALPAPTGNVVNVSTEAQLQTAIGNLTSGTTIVIAPGTYRLTKTLIVHGPIADVTVRGATNSRDDVILQGAGMTNPNHNGAEFGFWVGGEVQRLRIANLTIRDFYTHPIIMNPGPQAPHLYNIHVINGGEQLLKTNPNADGTGINDGIIEHSVFEYETTSRNWYANAIQVLAGANWIIRNNLIRNIRAPQGEEAGPAVLAWISASGTIVEGNTFINCQREISFGLGPRTPNDHIGGIIRNNFIYRDATVTGGDVSIQVFDSPNTQVLHNSIYSESAYPNAIEVRFPDTTGVLIANNLMNKAIAVRDGAAAPTLQSNVLTATLDLFQDAPAGNMHLQPGATIARNAGTPTLQGTTDWDGQTRPIGGAPDVGADEDDQASQPPAAPQNLRIVPTP
jgi:hypothetical protein